MRRAVLGVPVLLALVAGCGPSAGAVDSAAPGPAVSSPSPTPSRAKIKSPAADKFKSPRTYDEVAEPTRVRIPSIGVNSALEHLGRVTVAKKDQPVGSIALPDDADNAGWFDGGPRPGEPGPAVIIGHDSWDSGPSVFADLTKLGRGDVILVDRADGTTARFRVTSRKQVAKDDFPTDAVYAPDLAPSLRLITCGGPYDAANQNFLDNVIVFATPA